MQSAQYDSTTVQEWILDQIAQRTEPDPESDKLGGEVWAAEKRIFLDAEKATTPHSRAAVEREMAALTDENRVLRWFGSVTLATDEYLRAVVQSEANSDPPRKILVGEANQLRRAGVDNGN
jgi:hypothetical protein